MNNKIILLVVVVIICGLILSAVFDPSQKSNSPSFKQKIDIFIHKIQKIIMPIFNYINPFPYQSLLVQIFICYIIFFSIFISHPFPILKRWSKITDIILISILVTLFLAVFIQFNVPFEGNSKNPPGFDPNIKHFKKHVNSYLITLGVILFIILIGLGISYLAASYTNVSLLLYTLLMVALALGLIYMLLTILNKLFSLNVPSLMTIMSKILFYITHTIFPLVQNSIEKTPTSVFLVLGVELIALLSYFIIPMIVNSIYLTNPGDKDHNELLGVRIKNTKNSIRKEKELIIDLKGGIDIDWSSAPHMSDADLRIKLYDLGFTASNIDATIKLVRKRQDSVNKSEFKLDDLKSTFTRLEKEEELDSAYTSTILLRDAVYTDRVTIAGNFENLIDSDFHVYQYTLSSWFFVHDQGSNHNDASNKFTSLLNYGGKPNILYNIKEHTLQIKMLSGKKEKIIYETKNFPLQKWNNIVINYDKGTFDIFINAKLVSSTPEIVPYMTHENITIGSQDGVSGGVANIVYYTGNLSKTQIDIFYKLLKDKTTPTFP